MFAKWIRLREYCLILLMSQSGPRVGKWLVQGISVHQEPGLWARWLVVVQQTSRDLSLCQVAFEPMSKTVMIQALGGRFPLFPSLETIIEHCLRQGFTQCWVGLLNEFRQSVSSFFWGISVKMWNVTGTLGGFTGGGDCTAARDCEAAKWYFSSSYFSLSLVVGWGAWGDKWVFCFFLRQSLTL